MPPEDDEPTVGADQPILTADTMAQAVQAVRRDHFGTPAIQQLILHPQDQRELENLLDFRRRLREHVNNAVQGVTVMAEADMPNGDTIRTEHIVNPDAVRNMVGIDWTADLTRQMERQLREHAEGRTRDQLIEAARARVAPLEGRQLNDMTRAQFAAALAAPMRVMEPEPVQDLRWRIVERMGPTVINPRGIANINLMDPRFEEDTPPCVYRCRCGEYMTPLFQDAYLYGMYTLEVPVWKCIPCETMHIFIKRNLRYMENAVYQEVNQLKAQGIKQIKYKDLLSVICTDRH